MTTNPRIPEKTLLTVVTFIALILLPQIAPVLKNYASLEPGNIPKVWNFPPRKSPDDLEFKPASDAELADLRNKRQEATAPQNLVDPQHELDHFYASLLKGGLTRILHYGDSPTTADLITADARTMLQKQFGDGGSGFVLIARPWAWYNHRGVEMEASNWKIDVAGTGDLRDGLYGLGGVSFRGQPGAVARWKMKDSTHHVAEVAYLGQPDGGDFALDAEGQQIGAAQTASESRKAAYAKFDLPPGATHFALRVTRGAVRVFGVEFRKEESGVIYSSLGINGANVTLLSHAMNEGQWTAQLRHYNPDLVIINYGTNESGFPQFVDGAWGKEMREVVRRVRAALPESSILLMSPMDRGERKASGEIDTIPAMPRLVNTESRIALDSKVAFFNTFQAMGGQGTMGRWYNAEPRLVGADYIHPMPAGAKIVGQLLYSALRDGYNQYKMQQLKDKIALAPEKLSEAGRPVEHRE